MGKKRQGIRGRRWGKERDSEGEERESEELQR